MYRVLAVILLAYAVCYPKIASEAKTDLASFQRGPTRAERIVADLDAWLLHPIDLILAALYKQPPG